MEDIRGLVFHQGRNLSNWINGTYEHINFDDRSYKMYVLRIQVNAFETFRN